MRHRQNGLNIALLAVFSIVAALLPVASPASAAYPPLSTAGGKPATAAHRVRLEKGMVEVALQVLAPGKTLEAVRIDNMGGVSSHWRSDGKDGAEPLSVSRGGASLSSGAQAMNLALGDAETLLSLSLKDNGAFAGKDTDFRVTVFFSGGGRALYALAASDFPPTALARTRQEAPAPPAAKPEPPITPDPAAQSEPLADKAQKAGTQAPTPPPPNPRQQQYDRGWLARIISVPEGFNITDPLPPLEVVRFVATKPNYTSLEYLELVEGAFLVNFPLWKAEAFLRATETGNYIFSVSSSGEDRYRSLRNIPTAKAIYVEDVQVAAASGSDDTLMGAAELVPGLYKVEFRIVVDTSIYPLSSYSRRAWSPPNYNITLQVKRPFDNGLLPASQVLVLPTPDAGNQ